MKKIDAQTSRAELAAIVVAKLKENGINAVLVGGSVVSIYTDNKYESNDLDFISAASHKKIEKLMYELGFRSLGKDFIHDHSRFTVEFPTGPIGLGDDVPVLPEGKLNIDGVEITLLSPTQSAMDRLSWFFFSDDRQCLDQAVWIAEKHPLNLEKLKAWAKRERQEEKLQIFLRRIKATN